MSKNNKSRSNHATSNPESRKARGITRREFLETSALVCAAGLLTACARTLDGTNAPITSADTATQTPLDIPPTTALVYYEPPAPEGSVFEPAINPPEYKALATEISGIDPKQLEADRYTQWYRLYKQVNGLEGEASPFSGASLEEARQNYEQAMQQFSSEHPEVEVRQVQSEDRASLLTYLVRGKGEGYVVYWGFTPDGAVAFAEPDLVENNTVLGEVAVPEGLRPEFVYNPEDGHWYMFAVDELGEAVLWFRTDGATRDNIATQWEEIINSGKLFGELQSMLPEGILVNSIEDLGDGAFRAANENGTTLFIKPNKDSEWLLAPAGFHKIYGAWQEWNPQTKQFKNNYDPDLSPVAELCNSYLRNEIQPGTVGIAGDVLGFNMQVKPEMAEKAYEDRIKVLAESSHLRKFWNSLGVAPNKEALLKWLKSDKSIGGPENKPGWVPVGPDAPAFNLVLGRKKGLMTAEVGELDLIRSRGGFYLDAVEVGLQSWTEANNPWIAAWMTSIKTLNTVDGTNNLSLIHASPGGSVFFGYQLDPYSNRLIFLCGEMEYSTAIMGGDKVYLGGEKPGSYRDPGTAIVAMEYLALYEVAMGKPNIFFDKQLTTHSPGGTGSGTIYQLETVITSDDTIFETKN